MKIGVVQTRPVKGNVGQNVAAHERWVTLAADSGAEMVIFPELSLTGYEPTLAAGLAMGVDDPRLDGLQALSDERRVTIGAGLPLQTGAGVAIAMALLQPQQPRRPYGKQYLHADEVPFFVPGVGFPVLQTAVSPPLALAICYELSIPAHAETAHRHGAGVYIASVSKSADGVVKAGERLAAIARQYGMPVLMANNVGSSDDFVGGGGTAVWDRQGSLLHQLDEASEGFIIYDSVVEQMVMTMVVDG
ncbi:MAG: carbon-nitrogen hydrolase family protein [Chloroflexota bacterium]